MTDRDLLRQYLANRSQSAFAELVSRHVALVYSVANRHVKDVHRAEDICQNVFALLMQKAAAIGPETPVAAWLHQTAHFMALSSIRDHSRRHHHEHEAAMNAPPPPSADPAWPVIAGEIDDAVQQLDRPQRDAILLRFFAGKSYPEISEELSLSEEAARKRVDRALEALRESLTRRGLAVPAVVLAALLLTNATQAAPTGLAAALAAKTVATSLIFSKAMLAVSAVIAALVAAVMIYAAAVAPPIKHTLAVVPKVSVPAIAPAAATHQASLPLPKTAYLQISVFQNTTIAYSADIYYRNPNQIHEIDRNENRERDSEDIFDGQQLLRLNPTSHLYHIEATSPLVDSTPPSPQVAMVKLFLQLAALPVAIGENPINGPLKLKFEGTEKSGGKVWRVYTIQDITTLDPILSPGETKATLAFDDDSHTRIVLGRGAARFEIMTQVNMPLDDALFGLKPPIGYSDVQVALFGSLSPEIRAIADKYYAAREAIPRYRMICVQNNYPMTRQIRDGDRWRLDQADIEPMVATAQAKDFFRIVDPLQAGVTALLDQFCTLDFPFSHTVMTYEGQLAHAGYFSTSDGGPAIRAEYLIAGISNPTGDPARDAPQRIDRLKTRWYNQAPRRLVGPLADNDLRQLAWPAWKGDNRVTDLGWDLTSPVPSYYLLPKHPDHPEFIGIRAINANELTDYWIDPGHDYLCVSCTEITHQDAPWAKNPAEWMADATLFPDRSRVPAISDQRDIIDMKKTSTGRWYPRQIGHVRPTGQKISKGTIILLDTPEKIAPALLDWPANMPKPLLPK